MLEDRIKMWVKEMLKIGCGYNLLIFVAYQMADSCISDVESSGSLTIELV